MDTTENIIIVTSRGLLSKAMQSVIQTRDTLLKEADYLVNTAEDNGIDSKPYRQYRQALRDIPQTYTNPDDVVWPQKPSLPLASS